MEEYRELLHLSRDELFEKLRERPIEFIVVITNCVLFCITIGLFVTIRTDNASQSPTLIQKKQTVPPTAYLDVGGAVVRPGVYAIRSGQRVFELIEKAGGLSPDADMDYYVKNINRAQKLNDQEKIYIPFQQEFLSSVGGPTSDPVLTSINTSSQESLEKLPGVGPIIAEAIIRGRPYLSLEELIQKKVLKNGLYEKIRTIITL